MKLIKLTTLKMRNLILGSVLFLIGQVAVFYQINGQFFSKWFKEHPLLTILLGIPISAVYLYGAKYLVAAFEGELWPTRLIAYAIGIFAFTVLTYLHLNEGITMKTGVCLLLSVAILLIQLFWK